MAPGAIQVRQRPRPTSSSKVALGSSLHFGRKTTHVRISAALQPNPNSTQKKSIFIFGLGYTSVALGNWLAEDGWKVTGTCRTQFRVDGLRAKGWAVDVYDPARGIGLNKELFDHLEDSPYVLSSVPPLGMALYDPALSAQKALLRPLATLGRIAWFGYLSSTGVYGDWQGEWVDESSPCRQTSSKAIVRQEAEAEWLQMYAQYRLPAHIFRLGGIYGPGRSVLDPLGSQPSDLSARQQRRGRQRYTARCHVYDICAVLTASMAAPRAGSVYNVVDDDPAPRTEVMSYARSLLAGRPSGEGHLGIEPQQLLLLPDKAPDITTASDTATSVATSAATSVSSAAAVPPPSEKISERSSAGDVGSDDCSGAGRRRSTPAGPGALEEKRVRNLLIKSELGLDLRYPSYREGVAAIHRREYWPLSAEDLELLT